MEHIRLKALAPVAKLWLRAPLWTALLPLLLGLQFFFPNKVWMALLVGLGGVWLVAYVWAMQLKRHICLEREMRYGWAQVGDRLEERFTLINTGLAPAIWLEIIDQSTLPGYEVSQVTAISDNARNSWKTSQVCSRRGVYTLGPTQINTGDPFGLFHVTIDIPGIAALMVRPPIVPLPAIEVIPGGRVGEGRRARPDPLEPTVSTSSVRKYQQGDPLRWVHWPISTRHQEIYVRTFDTTPSSDWWIILDLQAKVQVGKGWNSTDEHGIILAASLADRGLRLGHAVGIAFAGEKLVWLSPSQSADQQVQILNALALASLGNTPLAQVLEAARPALRRGASLIVITPSMQAEWLEALAFFTRKRFSPTVLFLDPASYGADVESSLIQARLIRLGVNPYVIRRDLLDRPEAHPGHAGEWEWKVTAHGRAIPIRKPTDLSWHKLGR